MSVGGAFFERARASQHAVGSEAEDELEGLAETWQASCQSAGYARESERVQASVCAAATMLCRLHTYSSRFFAVLEPWRMATSFVSCWS